MKVVAFNGSPRLEGNTALMLRTVTEALEAHGIATETVRLTRTAIRGCVACYQCRERQDGRCAITDDIVNECVAKMREADGMLLASPVYFADITPELKALIDRAGFVARSNGHLFRRKVGAGLVAQRRAGALHALDSISHFFQANQIIVPGSSYWNLGFGGAKGEVAADEEGLATMSTLGENMAWLLKKVHG